MTFLTTVILLALQSSAQQVQQPQQAQISKASIEGFVLRAGTNEPIRRARITVTRTAAGGGAPVQLNAANATPPVTTDDQGHFAVKDLEPGSYALTAQRNGFARQAYGESSVGRPGSPMNIVAGQAVKDIVFLLIPAGVVSGRISDSTGEPLPGINVQLLRSSYDQDGGRTFQTVGTGRTNDRGEYRIYWVTPGRYYVNASPNRSPGESLQIQPTTNEVIDPGYVLTYYPGTTDPSTAASVEVQPGAELSTIDLTLSQQQLFRIRGRVFDSRTGQFPRSASIIMRGRNPSVGFLLIGSYNNTNGTFELRDVPPGSYWIRADAVNSASPGPGSTDTGQVVADVSNADVDNLTIAFMPGFSIAGHLSIEGGTPLSSLPNSDMIRISLIPTAQGVLRPRLPPLVLADGSFKIENVQPGDYHVVVLPLPQGMYLKEARLGQTDALSALSISGSISGALDIVLSPNGGQLNGTIMDKDHIAARGIQAVLIPDRQRDRHDLYRTAISDQNGHFTMRSLVPGDYKLFAWQDVEPFAYNDPDFLRKYEESGVPVKVSESANLNIEAKMIPANQ